MYEVRSIWRPQSETVEQIISKVSKVAHLLPEPGDRWSSRKKANMSAFRGPGAPDNQSYEEYVITWKFSPDGTPKIASTSAKPMELGGGLLPCH
ncbi:hypothetical protein [Bradyrhizobium sp. USDA 3458]|uniref:hypothetical protein n=1 Tax=Bradyrhizobium sp. USDA 3458 TaxID=2591461 RepID=UPI0011413A44|nr:hypothetical protein [Bradyrhizobium sp. USDA 3458]